MGLLYKNLNRKKLSIEKKIQACFDFYNEGSVDEVFKARCYLSYRVIDGLVKHDDSRYIKVVQEANSRYKSLNLLQQIRWGFSFYAVDLYKGILIHKTVKKSLQLAEKKCDKLQVFVRSFPSCVVNLTRIRFLVAYHYYLTDNREMAIHNIHEVWNSFRQSMAHFSFNENISKSDEIRNLSEVLIMIQFLSVRMKILRDSQERRLPPILPKHKEHKQFKESVLSLDLTNPEKAIAWR